MAIRSDRSLSGRVYNADTGTTNLPFPPNVWGNTPLNQVSDLPATKSGDFRFCGIETRSFPMPRDDKGNPTGKLAII